MIWFNGIADVNRNTNKINRAPIDIILLFFFFSNKMDTGGRSVNRNSMYAPLVNANRTKSQVVRKTVKDTETGSNL